MDFITSPRLLFSWQLVAIVTRNEFLALFFKTRRMLLLSTQPVYSRLSPKKGAAVQGLPQAAKCFITITISIDINFN